MWFRLLMQPGVAIFFAVRAGLRDARLGKPSILCDLLSDPITRQERFRQVWKDVGTVFIVALVLDSIYQVIVQGGIFALELLITAAVLALVPYVVSRGLFTMIAKWRVPPAPSIIRKISSLSRVPVPVRPSFSRNFATAAYNS